MLNETAASGPRLVGQTEVNLTDEDLTGIVIIPFKPAEVRVRVVIKGEEMSRSQIDPYRSSRWMLRPKLRASSFSLRTARLFLTRLLPANTMSGSTTRPIAT